MILAQLNLHDESWHFITLLIALFQPLFILLLIGGFIIASAHLITMIGTRWGDRQAGSKAFLFSIGIHAILVCGLIALLPEYHQNVFADLASLDESPIRVSTVPDKTAIEAVDAVGGNTPIWDQIKTNQPQEWERFQAPLPDLTRVDRALDKPNENVEITPDAAPDSNPLPSESLPVPEQMIAAERGVLREATVEVQPKALSTETNPDSASFSAAQSRLSIPLLGIEEIKDVKRPTQGSVDQLSPEMSQDRRTQSIPRSVTPDAEIALGPTGNVKMRRERPAPFPTDLEALGLPETRPEKTSSRQSPISSQIARTQTRPNLAENDVPAIGRFRPSMTPQAPDPVLPELGSSVSSRNQFVPVPGERPQMVLPDNSQLARVIPESVPSAYLLRSENLRQKAILKYGGSDASENAVDLSLKWLATMQNKDGYWDASLAGAGQVGVDDEGIDRKYAGRDADTGVTALAVLAFLGKMNTVEQGLYSANVKRALIWLIAQQKPIKWPNGETTSGYLGGNATQFAGMYCHGMATFAIAEAYALSQGSEEAEFLRDPLERAINFILVTQINDGGWRYVKGQPDGDMSMFGWQLMALKSAEAGGLTIPFETKDRMYRFLSSRKLGRFGGLAGYREGEPHTPAMTAEALFCRQILGIDNDLSATEEATRYLLANRPNRASLNLYYWYYGTLAMHQRGGKDWEQWNLAMRDLIISEQRAVGPLAGSWDPRGIWGAYGGRIYSTAIATLSLEVYYRYLRSEILLPDSERKTE